MFINFFSFYEFLTFLSLTVGPQDVSVKTKSKYVISCYKKLGTYMYIHTRRLQIRQLNKRVYILFNSFHIKNDKFNIKNDYLDWLINMYNFEWYFMMIILWSIVWYYTYLLLKIHTFSRTLLALGLWC